MRLFKHTQNEADFMLVHGDFPEGFEREVEVNGYEEVNRPEVVDQYLRAFTPSEDTAPVEEAEAEEQEAEVDTEEMKVESVDIASMNFFKLRAYAKELGLEFPRTVTGDELRALVSEHLAE